eukprot:TRINITY_DN13335_c0_g1_i1.p1 TRINITY_DN13335_c0_g1~~TRINITY_DN13335_c0_g1_i1.p1  ORF type:complete len:431 (+),score=69.74 TRINITY_DN13335_c0_g1_i1:83-1375(+)
MPGGEEHAGSSSPIRRNGPKWADISEDADELLSTDEQGVKRLSLFSALGVEDTSPLRRASVSSSTVTGPSDASASEVASSAGTNSPRTHDASTDDLRGRARFAKGGLTLPVNSNTVRAEALFDKRKKGGPDVNRIVEVTSISPDASPNRRRNRNNKQPGFPTAVEDSKAVKSIALEKALGNSDDRGRSRKQKKLEQPRNSAGAVIAASASPCRSQITISRFDNMAQSSSPVRARLGPMGIMGTDFHGGGGCYASFGQGMQEANSPVRRSDMSWRQQEGSPTSRNNGGGAMAGFDWAPVEENPMNPLSMLSTSPCASPVSKGGRGVHTVMPQQMMMPQLPGSSQSNRAGGMQGGYQAAAPSVLTSTLPPSGPMSVSGMTPQQQMVPSMRTGNDPAMPMAQVFNNVFGAGHMTSPENLQAQLLAAAPEIYED